MRIVFMGTPDFGVYSIRKLTESSHKVVGVVTQPDRPKGRGRRLASSSVKKEAQKLGIPIFQPQNLKEPEFLGWLAHNEGDCFVVVGFRILPPEVYEMPSNGTINLHASLLPKYRGAAPIQWALINGEEETGVTTFFIERKVDTGDIILQEKITIGKDETAGELHDRLAVIGADLIVQTVDLIERGTVEQLSQKGTPTLAPKIQPEHCEVNWSLSSEHIVNLVRGLSPRPGAFTMWNNKRLKIFHVSVVGKCSDGKTQPGRVIEASDEGIIVEAADGCVCIGKLQVEGKKRMKVGEFLKGRDISIDTVFG